MKDNLDLNALRTFRRVVEAGGFTAAAHRSHRAVSSVSRQIATLERRLGQSLFHRHSRAVRLTEAGARYIEAIGPLLAQLESATEAVFDADHIPRGRLTINAPVAFGERQVIPLIDGFRRQYPQVRAELRLTDAVLDPVRSGSDITFRVGRLADSGLVARTLAPMRYIPAAAPAYLAAHGGPQRPADLLAHPCLLYQGEYGRQRWFWRPRAQRGFQRLEVDGPLYSNDAASLRAAALLGQGSVLFPSWLIDRELAAGTLLPLLEDWEWEVADEDRAIHMLYEGTRLRPAKVRRFVDYTLDSIGTPPRWDRWR